MGGGRIMRRGHALGRACGRVRSARDAPHVAFGAGPHRCVGAAFARRILTAFFEQWFARVPAHRAIGERRASSYMNGFARLEIAI
jgi:cytochrome P450